MTRETERARRPGGESRETTRAETPKNAPWGRPAKRRAEASTAKLGAIAESRFPSPIRAISSTSSRARGILTAAIVTSGAPITTPRA